MSTKQLEDSSYFKIAVLYWIGMDQAKKLYLNDCWITFYATIWYPTYTKSMRTTVHRALFSIIMSRLKSKSQAEIEFLRSVLKAGEMIEKIVKMKTSCCCYKFDPPV